MPQTRFVKGIAVSTGLAHGPVHVVRAQAREVPAWTVAPSEVPNEIGRLAAALNAAADDLAESQKRVAAQAGEKDAEIFSVHRMILTDPSALGEVEKTIAEERINAESAVQRLIARFKRTLGALEGENVRGFAADVSDPWQRVMDKLMVRDREEVGSGTEQVVLAASELTPQVVTWLPRERVLAIVCEKGGRFSHGAVLARSLGVPCVVGLPNLLSRLEQNMPVAVDGDFGGVQLRPSVEDLAEFQQRLEQREARRRQVLAGAGRAPTTACGHAYSALVNIESVRDLDTFDVNHTDGVGLLRTEFLYMERTEFPSEEEQYRLYRRVVEHMDGRPMTLRTLDIGADKQLPYFQTPDERNPALGWRGIRISLQWPDLLQVQLRAALRASAHGPVRLLLPMVGSLEQIDEAHAIYNDVRASLTEQGYELASDLPVGVMIEVPSLLFSLHQVIEHVDFVSVGTNDLVQYLLAVDRDNSFVAPLYQPHHPSVIAALARVAEIAAEAGKSCSVCGDIAADPAMAVLLIGLGFDSLSTAPQFTAEIKHALRAVTFERAQEVARLALAEHRADGVRDLLRSVRDAVYKGPVRAGASAADDA